MERLSAKRTIKIDASEVQGKGAYVIWRPMTRGERRQIVSMAGTDEFNAVKLILSFIVKWNWVDVDGKPLKVPETEEEFDFLYDEEVEFLAGLVRKAIAGRLEFTEEAEKN